MLYWLTLFFAIIILGSPAGLSNLGMHVLASIFALINIKELSKFYIFWLLLLVNLCLASEPRFSLEFFLLAAGFSAWAFHPTWQNLKENKRKVFLLIIFTTLVALNYLKISFSERGSLLLWLPIYLAVFYQKNDKAKIFDKKNLQATLMQIIGIIILIFSNKKTALLAQITSIPNYFKKKWLWLLLPLGLLASLFAQDSLKHFINKSLLARLFIWKSSFNGFVHSPLWGQGFGTYSLDNGLYKITAVNFGARAGQQVIHGHSTLMHLLFEQGLLGLIAIIALAYCVYLKDKKLLIPFSIVMLMDSSLFTFNQYLLAGLILLPYIKPDLRQTHKLFNLFCKTIPEKYSKLHQSSIIVISSLVFIMSTSAHYFYGVEDFDTAIKIDRYHALYYFMRGARDYQTDTSKAEEDFIKAVEYAPGVGYFYGFLASAKLSNFKFAEANYYSKEAIRLSGKEGSWYFINALANYNNQDYYQKQIQEAYRMDPPIKEIIEGRLPKSLKCIGKIKRDPRVQSFYRRGRKVFLPIPQLPEHPLSP